MLRNLIGFIKEKNENLVLQLNSRGLRNKERIMKLRFKNNLSCIACAEKAMRIFENRPDPDWSGCLIKLPAYGAYNTFSL